MFYHALPKYGAIRRMGRWLLRMVRPYRDPRVQCGIEHLNLWQEGFCAWNAERLGISDEESRHRYRASWQVLPEGHAGDAYRRFAQTQMAIFSVIANDSVREIYDSYRLHDWLFLLRQISLPVPLWRDTDPLLQAVREFPAPVIIDYGCGMAQTSISLALALRQKGVTPRLVLADIPSIRMEFVAWLCRRLGLSHETLPCTRGHPLPDLPQAHVVIATEVFGHLHDPVTALERLDAALHPGGFLVTSLDDREAEIMRIHPSLDRLRHRLASLGYVELARHTRFRKMAAAESLPAAAKVTAPTLQQEQLSAAQ